jgi:Dyp-type peroxidase family
MPAPDAGLGPSVAAVRDIDFDDLQGNILSGYRLPYGAFLLVKIGDPSRGRAWLRELLRRDVVTTARAQRGKPRRASNVAFTFAGLRTLEVADRLLRLFPEDLRQGMEARADRLGDLDLNDPVWWETGLRDADQGHVMLMLRAQKSRARNAAMAREYASIKRHRLAVVYAQSSDPLPSDRARAQMCGAGDREHFGFADGCSQPAIAGAQAGEDDDRQRINPGEILLGYLDENDDIPGAAKFFRNGSFMVFRKLEQRVAAFRNVVAKNACGGLGRDELEAKIVGRWRNGEPLVVEQGACGARDRRALNNFRYGTLSADQPEDGVPHDPDGFLCPLGAHIRRAFPRDALVGGDGRTRRHRILRRGMPYGAPLAQGEISEGKPDRGRGLLFICFNASIARQFETVQSWCLDGNLFDVPGEPDFLLGPPVARMTIQQRDGAGVLERDRQLVYTKGGGYFFYPSVPALKAIADGNYFGQLDALTR